MNWFNLKKSYVVGLTLVTIMGAAVHLSADVPAVWTTVFKQSVISALLSLRDMRVRMQNCVADSKTCNLFDTYEDFPKGIICDEQSKVTRTADGTCNDLSQPAMGAANIRFGRNVPLDRTFGETGDELMFPNPREISNRLMARTSFKEVGFLNLLASAWIQFQVHDWFNHVENTTDKPYAIDLPKNDPWRLAPTSITQLFVPRTKQDSAQTDTKSATYINENTHWWDGSQIYGSSKETQNLVRSFKAGEEGKLTVVDGTKLPLQDEQEVTGFKRNWWAGLSILHNLFVLEHNRIVDRLVEVAKKKKELAQWDSDRLFNTARLINAAVMAKIHTVEWTPAILNNKILEAGMNANWSGHIKFLKNVSGKFNFLGLVAKPKNLHDVPYSLTEEFVSVYRMHPLLPDTLKFRFQGHPDVMHEVPLDQTRDKRAHLFTDQFGLSSMFYSFGLMHPGELTLNNYPKFLRDLDIPVIGKMDLAAVDILRDRERGVPRYNEFRRLIGLPPVTKFEDFMRVTDGSNSVTIDKLRDIYKNDIEKVDLLVGCLAEGYRPDGFGFGETAFQIFLLMASRRLEADRFFTDDFRKEIYTQEGLDYINDASMKEILLHHFKDLAAPLKDVKNAFFPWKQN